MILRTVLAGAGLALLSARAVAQETRAEAQDTSEVLLGERLRVHTTRGPTVTDARAAGLQNGVLVLRSEKKAYEYLNIPMSEITRVEVRRRTGAGHPGPGALIGTVSGLVIFGALGYYSTRDNHFGDYGPGFGIILAGPGAGIGAITGLLIGSRVKSPQWVTIKAPLKLDDSALTRPPLR